MPTEWEKMIAGELYDASDPEIGVSLKRSRSLCKEFNATEPGQVEKRRRILTSLFAQGGDTARIEPPFFCDHGTNIHLGQSVFFNFNCVVLDVCKVTIGDFTLFGPSVQILTPLHPLDADLRRSVEYGSPIEIGEDVWVGGGAIICPGVRIGSRTVIGAGSVVTRDIPDDVVAVGNPCRVIKNIPESDQRPPRP